MLKEPIVREADPLSNNVGLRLGLGVQGVQLPQTEALFDILLIDTDTSLHKHCTVETVLESEKKRLYLKAVEEPGGHFTPFVFSFDGLLHQEAHHAYSC
ncbi:MAG: hypothetical protein ORN98_00870 [Alphaproteobacteria bacterium]|nr:hypothetical protein [Alphaproteobacteria bacterium]